MTADEARRDIPTWLSGSNCCSCTREPSCTPAPNRRSASKYLAASHIYQVNPDAWFNRQHSGVIAQLRIERLCPLENRGHLSMLRQRGQRGSSFQARWSSSMFIILVPQLSCLPSDWAVGQVDYFQTGSSAKEDLVTGAFRPYCAATDVTSSRNHSSANGATMTSEINTESSTGWYFPTTYRFWDISDPPSLLGISWVRASHFLFWLETIALMQIRGKYIVLWNKCCIVIDVIYSPDENFILPDEGC